MSSCQLAMATENFRLSLPQRKQRERRSLRVRLFLCIVQVHEERDGTDTIGQMVLKLFGAFSEKQTQISQVWFSRPPCNDLPPYQENLVRAFRPKANFCQQAMDPFESEAEYEYSIIMLGDRCVA